MEITVQLPDDLAQHPNPGREALEALAIEGYKAGSLSHHEASQILGLSRFEFDGFLKDRHVYDHAYDVEDLEEDLKTLRELQAKGTAPALDDTMIVVADTSPLNYLIQIECDFLLPKLYGQIIVPSAVIREMHHNRTPAGRSSLAKCRSCMDRRL